MLSSKAYIMNLQSPCSFYDSALVINCKNDFEICINQVDESFQISYKTDWGNSELVLNLYDSSCQKSLNLSLILEFKN